MKNKSWFKYLIYILLFIGLIYLDGYVVKQQTIYQSKQFELNFSYFIMSMIIKICIGSFLGLEYIIKEMRREGAWKINFPKLILMVLPSLYFSICYIFIYVYNSNLFIHRILFYPSFIFMKFSSGFIYIFQLMLGYFLVTSFYKQDKDIGKEDTI